MNLMLHQWLQMPVLLHLEDFSYNNQLVGFLKIAPEYIN